MSSAQKVDEYAGPSAGAPEPCWPPSERLLKQSGHARWPGFIFWTCDTMVMWHDGHRLLVRIWLEDIRYYDQISRDSGWSQCMANMLSCFMSGHRGEVSHSRYGIIRTLSMPKEFTNDVHHGGNLVTFHAHLKFGYPLWVLICGRPLQARGSEARTKWKAHYIGLQYVLQYVFLYEDGDLTCLFHQ